MNNVIFIADRQMDYAYN